MTAVLVAVTFGALGLAGALLFYVLRLTRAERDRSEARVVALGELIDEGSSAPEAAPARRRRDGGNGARPSGT